MDFNGYNGHDSELKFNSFNKFVTKEEFNPVKEMVFLHEKVFVKFEENMKYNTECLFEMRDSLKEIRENFIDEKAVNKYIRKLMAWAFCSVGGLVITLVTSHFVGIIKLLAK